MAMDNSTFLMNPAFLATVPILAPPLGLKSNFLDSPSRGYLVTVIGSVVLALQVLFFALRVYSRYFVAGRVSWDDLTCALGFACTFAFYVICILLVRTAYVGHHLWDYQLIVEILNPAALAFIKLTFFIFYWQLFSIKPWTRIAILLGAISSTLFYIICIAIQLHIGLPRKGETFFEHSNKIANDEKLFVIPQAGFSVFFDLYILVLPVWSIFQLNLSFRRAVGVSFVFLTGVLACVCSIISLYYRIRQNQTRDVFWILPIVLVTSLVEMQAGIICSCMPALPYLVRAAKKANSHSKSAAALKASKGIYVTSEVTTGDGILRSGWRGGQNVVITGGKEKGEFGLEDIGNAV